MIATENTTGSYTQVTPPDADQYHRIYVTYDKPWSDENYNYCQGVPPPQPPSIFREILDFSCSWAKGESEPTIIVDKIFDGCWSLGAQGYYYNLISAGEYRGLLRLLTEHNGACAEWENFLRAHVEAQGIDMQGVNVIPDHLKYYDPKTQKYEGYWMYRSKNIPSVGNGPMVIDYTGHAFCVWGSDIPDFNQKPVYDPTYHLKQQHGWTKYDDDFAGYLYKGYAYIDAQGQIVPCDTNLWEWVSNPTGNDSVAEMIPGEEE